MVVSSPERFPTGLRVGPGGVLYLLRLVAASLDSAGRFAALQQGNAEDAEGRREDAERAKARLDPPLPL
jgi:hypothetical protein